LSVDTLHANAEMLLTNSIKSRKNFVILTVRIGLSRIEYEGGTALPPASVVVAIGQLLRRIVRQTDHVAQTGEAEFTLVSGNINFDAARGFAQRVCRAIAGADMVKDEHMSFIASCGLVSLSEDGLDTSRITLQSMHELAHRRALLGMDRAITGVVGWEEERAFQIEETPVSGMPEDDMELSNATAGSETPDLATLLQWIKDGRQNEVLPHLGKLSAELQPLIDLVLKQNER
jgi:two-component system, cell cycle response regulator